MMTQNVPRMTYKKLSNYKLPKGQEIYYIKKFVNGVTKREFEYMFMSSFQRIIHNLAISSVIIDIANKSLKRSGLLQGGKK